MYLEHIANDVDWEKEIGSGGFAKIYDSLTNQGEVIKVTSILEPEAVDRARMGFSSTQPSLNQINYLRGNRLEIGDSEAYLDERALCLAGSNVYEHTILRLLADEEYPYVPALFEHGYGFDQKGSFCGFTRMSKVDGKTFTKIVLERDLSLVGLTDILHQVGLTIMDLHEYGIIHRDIKPDNVIVTEDNQVTLLDFGNGRTMSHFPFELVSGDQRIIEDVLELDLSCSSGTPAFMSPQQAIGGRATKAEDYFSFGAMTYKMITGEFVIPEFERSNPRMGMAMHYSFGQHREAIERFADCELITRHTEGKIKDELITGIDKSLHPILRFRQMEGLIKGLSDYLAPFTEETDTEQAEEHRHLRFPLLNFNGVHSSMLFGVTKVMKHPGKMLIEADSNYTFQ